MSALPDGMCPDPGRLVDFLDGALDAEASAETERHLASCDGCQEVIAAGAVGEGEGAREGLGEVEPGRTLVGRYELQSRAGRGASGEVWKARDFQLERTVAVKLLATRSPGAAEAFRLVREARLLAQLRHPHVLRVYDVGVHEGRPFLVTEWLEGGSLAGWLAQGSRSWKAIVRMFVEAGEGLSAAHRCGIVHRDFKPTNVLVDADGSRAQVADFGLARLPGDPAAAFADRQQPSLSLLSLTASGAVVGTPAYMSPEQLRGEEATPLSDQFSYCVALYEALTGKRPFTGATAQALLAEIQKGQVQFPSSPALPGALQRTLHRGLSASPEKRFADLQSLVAQLQQLETGPRRRRRWAAAAALMVSAAAVGTGAWAVEQRRLCSEGPRELAAHWGPSEWAALRKAWDAGVDQDEAGWSRIRTRVEGFSEEWASTWSQVCRATRIERRHTEATLGFQLGCLRRHGEQLRAVGQLVSALGPRARGVAAEAFAQLGVPSHCAEASTTPTSWLDTEGRGSVFRERLAKLAAYRNVGDLQAAEKEAQALLDHARQERFAALEAEVLHTQGSLHYYFSRFPLAYDTLRQAALVADAQGMDELRARVLVDLAFVSGVTQGRTSEALLLLDQADAAFARLGRERPPRDEALYARATVLFHDGRREEALPLFDEALSLMRQLRHDTHPKYVGVLRGRARTLLYLGRANLAAEQYREALTLSESLVGSSHPMTSSVLNDLATSYADAGRLRDALETFQRSRAALSPEERNTENAMITDSHIARMKAMLGRVDEAASELERLMAQSVERRRKAISMQGLVLGRAEVHSLRGQHDQAERTIRSHLDQLLLLRSNGHVQVARARCALGHSQLAQDAAVKALGTFEQALEALDPKIQSAPESECLHAGIALARAKLGQKDLEPHASLVMDATAHADTARARRSRSEVLSAQAQVAFAGGDRARGVALIEEALRAVEGLEGASLEAWRTSLRALQTPPVARSSPPH